MTLLLLLACTSADSADDTKSGSDTDSGLVDTAETGETGDTDSGNHGTGQVGVTGTATADAAGYAGTEDWYFIADSGDGEDVCRIRYTLTGVTARTDCDDCSWAWTLEVSDAEVVTDAGCAESVGVDATTVGSLDGTTTGYGYIASYYGHADVLAVDEDGQWVVETFAAWDEGTSAFSYDWNQGNQEW